MGSGEAGNGAAPVSSLLPRTGRQSRPGLHQSPSRTLWLPRGTKRSPVNHDWGKQVFP